MTENVMKLIEEKIKAVPTESSEVTGEHVIAALEAIRAAINQNGAFVIPVEITAGGFPEIDPENIKPGDTITLDEDVHMKPRCIQLADDSLALVAFTSSEEMQKGTASHTITIEVGNFLDSAMMNTNVSGIIINPWDKSFYLPKSNIEAILRVNLMREPEDERRKQINTVLAAAPEMDCNNYKLDQAINFAVKCHSGDVRKGTDRPYILHPVEALQILASMNADTNLMIAGVLHDTLEDTDATLETIASMFGDDVAELVDSHTEDKRKTWYQRKLYTVTTLPEEDLRHKMLTIADKLANLRSIYADYKTIGDELWTRFNAPKELQAWYYSKICDGLAELQNYPNTEAAYWELTGLYKDVFVTFAVDDDKGLLYQLGVDGESYFLKKGKPQWRPLEGKVSKAAEPINRKTAERIEENWNEPFWKTVAGDMADADYELYTSPSRSIFVRIQNGELTFVGEDTGEACRMINGKDEYEFRYHLDAENARRLIVNLRLHYSLRYKTGTVLKDAFGSDDGSVKFKEYCEAIGVSSDFSSH